MGRHDSTGESRSVYIGWSFVEVRPTVSGPSRNSLSSNQSFGPSPSANKNWGWDTFCPFFFYTGSVLLFGGVLLEGGTRTIA